MNHLSLLMSNRKSDNKEVRRLLEKNDLPYREVRPSETNGEYKPPKLLDRRRRTFCGLDEIREAVGKYLIPTEDGYFPKTNRTVLRESHLEADRKSVV